MLLPQSKEAFAPDPADFAKLLPVKTCAAHLNDARLGGLEVFHVQGGRPCDVAQEELAARLQRNSRLVAPAHITSGIGLSSAIDTTLHSARVKLHGHKVALRTPPALPTYQAWRQQVCVVKFTARCTSATLTQRLDSPFHNGSAYVRHQTSREEMCGLVCRQSCLLLRDHCGSPQLTMRECGRCMGSIPITHLCYACCNRVPQLAGSSAGPRCAPMLEVLAGPKGPAQ